MSLLKDRICDQIGDEWKPIKFFMLKHFVGDNIHGPWDPTSQREESALEGPACE
jgi:hypothetical protein